MALALTQCGPVNNGPMVRRQSPLYNPNTIVINQNTEFVAAQSPYTFTQSVYVTDTATLTVDPGVALEFTPGAMLYVDGDLVINGSGSSPASIQSLETGVQWGGLIFGRYSSGGNISFTSIKDAFVQVTGGLITMNHCMIENGVWVPDGSPVAISISGSSLLSFDGFAFSIKNPSPPLQGMWTSVSISGSTINGMIDFSLSEPMPPVNGTIFSIDNNVINGGIFIHGSSDIIGSTFSVSGNTITGSIGVAQPYSTNVLNPLIIGNNIINSNGYAVYGGGQLYNNYIAGNNGAAVGVADTTQGGVCDNTMDEVSSAVPPQFYRVDCVVNPRTTPN